MLFMSMSLCICRIRKRFLWSLGLDKDQIERDKCINLNQLDLDDVPLRYGLSYGSAEEMCEFPREGDMLNWLRDNMMPADNRDKERSGDYKNIYFKKDLEALYWAIRRKEIPLHYERNDDEEIHEGLTWARINVLDDIAEMLNDDDKELYYYIMEWV